ncbi:FAD-dependent oxidoreductase [Nocardia carnea]|uniref:FAD-dependent oxidoreductase n=1 Tax=Nocardia carnea TaxID=37328 RepID=UPI0032B01A51
MQSTITWDKTYDVVVVGSGGAALAGALAAAHRGLSTCVLEKSDRLGGTSAYSGRQRMAAG